MTWALLILVGWIALSVTALTIIVGIMLLEDSEDDPPVRPHDAPPSSSSWPFR